jgi:hypothetical protein
MVGDGIVWSPAILTNGGIKEKDILGRGTIARQ